MSVLPIGFGSADEGGYRIERSLRFNSSDSAYMNRTPASAGNRKTWTWSGWVKRAGLAAATQSLFARNDGSVASYLIWNSNNKLEFASASGSVEAQIITTPVYRDASAWYHVLMTLDTSQATSSNRVKFYVNGVQVTALDTASYPSQNYDGYVNTTQPHYIGNGAFGGTLSGYFNGYLTEINFIDGQALTPSSFGEFNSDTGVWQPIKYTGTYGTNGFYLNFSDNSGTTSTTLGKDSSGNGNNWTPNNFSVTAGAGNDSLVDTPTNYGTDTGAGGEVRGNYATLNPLSKSSVGTLSNGNLDIAYSGVDFDAGVVGTLGVSSGKWYFETTLGSDATFYVRAGFLPVDSEQKNNIPQTLNSNFVAGSNEDALDLRRGTGSGSTRVNLSSTTPVAGGVIGVSFDIDAGEMRFYYNGTELNVAITSGIVTGKTWVPFVSLFANDGMSVNFGQRPFAYTAPSGFKALCTQNLPEPTIVDGGEYFNTVLYTGNGSTQSVAVGFAPDFVWAKNRQTGGYHHDLYDRVRGNNLRIFSSQTSAETTGYLQFSSTGFDLSAGGGINATGESHVAWNWKANGAGSSNTAGSITSTVSVNTTSGFSIVTYTGDSSKATVGHGLGVAPEMIIIKNRSSGTAWWPVQHKSLGNGYGTVLFLNSTDAASAIGYWTAANTSTVFTLRTDNDATVNKTGDNYVAYCFAPVAGYSAFGSYVGNGSATDGPFIFLGFRPAYVMFKRTDSTSDWNIRDGARNPNNVNNNPLWPNLSSAESPDAAHSIDILSNGFKIRASSAWINASGGTFIYAAFAENPFKYSLAR